MLEQTKIGAKHSTVEQAEDNLKKTRSHNKITCSKLGGLWNSLEASSNSGLMEIPKTILAQIKKVTVLRYLINKVRKKAPN